MECIDVRVDEALPKRKNPQSNEESEETISVDLEKEE